jgi:hypothetical protein
MAYGRLEEKYLGNIKEVAEEYGLHAAIFDYKKGSGLESEGRYLILSPYKDTVDKAPLGGVCLETQLKLQESTPGMIYTNMCLFKLEEKEMHSTINDIYRYMKKFETVDVCFKEKELQIPFRIHGGTVSDIAEFNRNRTASSSEKIDAFTDKKYTEYLKEIGKSYEKNDSFKAVYNKDRKQEVRKVEDLMHKTDSTVSFQLDSQRLDWFREFMKREPNCSYWIGPAVPTVSFEIKEKNGRTYTEEVKGSYNKIVLDGAYEPMIYQYFMSDYRDIGLQSSTPYLVEKYCQDAGDIPTYTYIPEAIVDEFSEIAREKKLPWIFDVEGEFATAKSNHYPIVFPKVFEHKFEEIIYGLNKKHTLNEKHDVQMYQKARIFKMEKEKIEKANKPEKKKFFNFGL